MLNKKYRDLESLLADIDHWKLFCKLDEIAMANAWDEMSGWDGYEDALENEDLDDFQVEVCSDERMSQIHSETFAVFFNDELAVERCVHPEASRLYEWYRGYNE
jgi:hypothetical protein